MGFIVLFISNITILICPSLFLVLLFFLDCTLYKTKLTAYYLHKSLDTTLWQIISIWCLKNISVKSINLIETGVDCLCTEEETAGFIPAYLWIQLFFFFLRLTDRADASL